MNIKFLVGWVFDVPAIIAFGFSQILQQTIWPRSQTSHKKKYFYEFVANVLRDNIGILIFDLHGGCQRPNTIQRLHTLAMQDGPNIELKCQSVRSLYGVWPVTASMEVKNKYVYVITQDICNKFIEVHFFVGCMVSRPNPLLQDSTIIPWTLINKIAIIQKLYLC